MNNNDTTKTSGKSPSNTAQASNQAATQKQSNKASASASSTNAQQVTPQTWNTRYELAKNYQQPLHQKYMKWFEDMYAYVNRNKIAPWRSKVYMPIVASKVWDLIARFIQYRPGWDVSVKSMPVNVLSPEELATYSANMNVLTEKVSMALDYDYDNPLRDDSMQDELLGAMLDACVTGQGIGRVPYVSQSNTYINHPTTGDFTDYGKEKVTTAQEGYNDFQSINIFSFFPAPQSKNLQSAPWLILHYFKPKYELLNDGNNYQNLDQVGGTVTDDLSQYNSARNRLFSQQDSLSLDNTTDMVEIFECWDKASASYSILAKGKSGLIELLTAPNPYWHGKYPFVMFYIRRKPYQIWGESIFENCESLQAAINDVFNHHMDGLNMADGMIAIDESSVVEPYRVQPGGEIRYRGEVPKQFKFPSPDVNQLNMITNLINGAIENATISQYASGNPSSDTDQTQGTATGVTRIMEAAAEKVGFMRANFRRSWREVGQMWVSNRQQFQDYDEIVQTILNGAKTVTTVKPADLQGYWNIKVEDSSFEPVSKDQAKQDYLQFIANLTQWQQASISQSQMNQGQTPVISLDWNAIAIKGAEKYGENFSSYITTTQNNGVPTDQSQSAAPTTPTDTTSQTAPTEVAQPAQAAPSAEEAQTNGAVVPSGV